MKKHNFGMATGKLISKLECEIPVKEEPFDDDLQNIEIKEEIDEPIDPLNIEEFKSHQIIHEQPMDDKLNYSVNFEEHNIDIKDELIETESGFTSDNDTEAMDPEAMSEAKSGPAEAGTQTGPTTTKAGDDPELDLSLNLNGQWLSSKNLILAAIGVMKNRKARPNSKRISNWINRRYGRPMAEIEEELERLVSIGELARVDYKGSASFRIVQPKNSKCECGVCGKYFDQFVNLQNHVLSVHGFADFKTYRSYQVKDMPSRKQGLKQTPFKSENLIIKKEMKMEPKVKEEIIDPQPSQNNDQQETFVGIKSEIDIKEEPI